MEITLYIPDEIQMQQVAGEFSCIAKRGIVIFLQGELGAGKTTFVRGFLRSLGYEGPIRSPTFALVESYQINHQHIHHFDFYRINDAEEVEYLGLNDYFTSDAICLVEWPEKAHSLLPKPNICCKIAHPEKTQGRILDVVVDMDGGIQLLQRMKNYSWIGNASSS